MITSETTSKVHASSAGKAKFPLDIARIREDFPILKMKVHDKPLVYLDNAATTQKPQQVLDALNRFYTRECANIHRGLHYLSEQATVDYEHARTRVQRFLGAAESREIIFVRGTTEAINLVAHSFGRKFVGPGDEIITTTMEHHSNIVPWQMLCEEKGAKLRVVPINDAGELMLDEFEKLLNQKTRLVAVAHISNALGTVNPVRQMIEMAHARNIPILIDGAQAVAHTRIDVQELDCDFYCFSGHKIYGPTGVGVLYGKAQWLEQIPPYQGGGDMIISVTFEKTTYNCPPHKFEAGTPHIAGGICLGAAIEYIDNLGLDRVAAHELDLLEYATRRISPIPGLRIIGNAQKKSGALSFYLEDVHPHDIGTILDRDGVAIRAGHHCAMPVMDRLGIPATARASFACYNTREEVDALIRGVDKVREIFAR